jgi:hypothetical protein
METETKSVSVKAGAASVFSAFVTFLLLLTIIPTEGYAALCSDPNKSTGYFSGYLAAQNDFHAGHAKNENVNNTNSQYGQDYKQGYKDGWSDAEFNINVIERSLC